MWALEKLYSRVWPDVVYAQKGDIVDVYIIRDKIAFCRNKKGETFTTTLEKLSDELVLPDLPPNIDKPKKRR